MSVTVVVVDDQAVVREGLVLLLGLLPGIEVVGSAGDGEAALHLVAEQRPDVALMDLRMPRMDGVEATRRIRAEHPGTQVVVLTTYSDDESVFAALRAGARGFLTKSADSDEIAKAIATVVRGNAQLDPTVQRRLLDAMTAPDDSRPWGDPPDRTTPDGGRPPGEGPDPDPHEQPDLANGPAALRQPPTPPLGRLDATIEQHPPGSADTTTSTGDEVLAGARDGLTPREVDVLRLIADGLSNSEIAARLFISEATVKTHINNLFAKARLRDRAQAVTYAYRHGLVRPAP
ncbi:response regulator transcription factor [Nonomuraea sp. NEAU-A123]|uniref:response regulator transcription factor n=1 Tax=Nonomuraea sp. NEAU-A123 TaxID=2839649 RepID=UPI0025499831|nr:response regulator transcription factor [Nonomuraea sp. NEAU-A123]